MRYPGDARCVHGLATNQRKICTDACVTVAGLTLEALSLRDDPLSARYSGTIPDTDCIRVVPTGVVAGLPCWRCSHLVVTDLDRMSRRTIELGSDFTCVDWPSAATRLFVSLAGPSRALVTTARRVTINTSGSALAIVGNTSCLSSSPAAGGLRRWRYRRIVQGARLSDVLWSRETTPHQTNGNSGGRRKRKTAPGADAINRCIACYGPSRARTGALLIQNVAERCLQMTGGDREPPSKGGCREGRSVGALGRAAGRFMPRMKLTSERRRPRLLRQRRD